MNQHGHTPCGIAFVASAALLAMSALQVEADGSSVAKIYHPYVQPLERELELRLVAEQGRANEDVRRWRLGYCWSSSNRMPPLLARPPVRPWWPSIL